MTHESLKSSLTPHQAQYFAHELTSRKASDQLEKLTSTLSNAQVDLNPHQIEAALFAFKSPLSRGAILADEVGLGKTIEAGLVISQKWAERKRCMLLIVPSNLRKQWSSELQEKFFLPSQILETKSFNQIIKDGNLNPFNQTEKIVICSYHFARLKSPYIRQTQWDLVVIDEAHRLRNVYKTGNKIAREIKESLSGVPKILLTATPLQNSLLELYGLVSIIDDHVFGDLKSFKLKYARTPREHDVNESELGLVEPRQEMFKELRERLQPVCIRTLRRQVREYIKYTERIPLTQDYVPSDDEILLYSGMSDYLQKEKLYAMPSSQRQLMTLILRKLLASSSFAIASTLKNLVYKLDRLIVDSEVRDTGAAEVLEENFEGFSDTAEDWIDDDEESDEPKEDEKKAFTEDEIQEIRTEREELDRLRSLASKIFSNTKGQALLTGLKKGFEKAEELGASRKAIIFTESTVTQKYLVELLSENGYEGKIVLFNGTNGDQVSKDVYTKWVKANADTDKVTGSKTADMRAALVECFREEAEIMIATEAGAEGINLQFCSLVINYDLPWNPQRIEQRIGRCHRYGQKHDVVVINFVNRKNAADQRVYELLAEKFQLFKGVFGASDEVLGVIESGVDFEKRIAAIYQNYRSEDEINAAFDELQQEMESSITETLQNTRQTLLENFDEEVHQRLKFNLDSSRAYLDRHDRWLWEVSKHYLGDNADFKEDAYAFTLSRNPFPEVIADPGPYRIGKNIEDAHIYRPGHPLAMRILDELKKDELPYANITLDYSNRPSRITVLENLVGKSGYLLASFHTIEAFESEDHSVVVALDENGGAINPEDAAKILELSHVSISPVYEIPTSQQERLIEMEQERIHEITAEASERNSNFFDEEVDKLDKWSDDMKSALELEIKKLDIEIKTAKTNAKKIVRLEEKLDRQREIKAMEKKRNEMRSRLFTTQDEIDDQKETLIEKVERQLHQRSETKRLFIIRWNII